MNNTYTLFAHNSKLEAKKGIQLRDYAATNSFSDMNHKYQAKKSEQN